MKNFGDALEHIKNGGKAKREGWNGKEQYIVLGLNLSYDTIETLGNKIHHLDIGSRAIIFVGIRGSQAGWLASQADMLSEDWILF